MGLWILDRLTVSPPHYHTPSSRIGQSSPSLQHPLADNVPAIELAYKFTNIPLSDTAHSIGEKVRSVTYNKDACVSVWMLEPLYTTIMYACLSTHHQVLASLQSSACNASVYFWDTFTFQQVVWQFTFTIL